MVISAGKGSLTAANPRGSKVSHMEVVGSCLLPLAFAPVDHVFNAAVRVVVDLPYAIVLWTAFFKEHRSTISFEQGEFAQRLFLAGYHLPATVLTRRHRKGRLSPYGSSAPKSTPRRKSRRTQKWTSWQRCMKP